MLRNRKMRAAETDPLNIPQKDFIKDATQIEKTREREN